MALARGTSSLVSQCHVLFEMKNVNMCRAEDKGVFSELMMLNSFKPLCFLYAGGGVGARPGLARPEVARSLLSFGDDLEGGEEEDGSMAFSLADSTLRRCQTEGPLAKATSTTTWCPC